jgi:hypothetical protein
MDDPFGDTSIFDIFKKESNDDAEVLIGKR